MKVIAFKQQKTVMVEVEMEIEELYNLAGFDNYSDFNTAFGTHADYGGALDSATRKSFYEVENIPVTTIFEDAKETLRSYEVLRTKFESIRNQLSTMLKKMVRLQPKKEKK